MIVKAVESITLAIAAMTAAVFNNLAVAITPLSPAIYTGYAIGDMLQDQIGVAPAVLVGLTFAMGLESAGYKSFGIAISEAGWRSKMYPVAYIALGIAVAVSVKPDAALLGVVMFLLPALVYSADAKRRASVEQKEDEADEKQFEREMKRRKLAAQERLKLAEIERGASTVPAQSQPVPAPSHECEGCGRSFGTSQALNAHKRFCKAEE